MGSAVFGGSVESVSEVGWWIELAMRLGIMKSKFR